MKLQGRELSSGTKGDDVLLLQDELRQLGVSIKDRKGFFGETTFHAVRELQKQHGLEATGVVDESTAKMINAKVGALRPKLGSEDKQKRFIVKGQIRQADGSPSAGALVRAFDKDLRSEERLGEATSDQNGCYEIPYSAEQFRRAEKKSADLRVCVCNEDGRELVSSPIIFNARPVETVDLVLSRQVEKEPSEYERYLADLTPVLQGVPIAELTEGEQHQDITFLGGETGITPERITFLVEAHWLSGKTNLPPEVFYGLFRQNLPITLSSLLAYPSKVLRLALENALQNNIIPARLRAEVDHLVERLRELTVEQALEKSDEKGKTSLGELLGTSGLLPEKQKQFLALYLRHGGPVEDFWNNLRAHPEFKAHVDALQLTLQLSALTQNYLPLVQELQRMHQTREFTQLQDLAKYDVSDWQRIISKQSDGRMIGFPPDVRGTDDQEKIGNYAKAITRLVEDAFPTAAIAQRLVADAAPDMPFKAEEKEDLVKFLANSPDFEFATTHVDSYLTKNHGALTGVKNREVLTTHLKGIQRLSKLTSYYPEIRTLLAKDYHSAQSIVRDGKSNFVRKVGDTLDSQARAETIYDTADFAASLSTIIYAKHGAPLNSIKLYATAGLPDDVEEIPDWRTLFGSLDLCACEHCRSVYSPAAYLVDILSFLRRPKVIHQDGAVLAKTAKHILFERRPDIGEIELTCENTDTPMPYVDLVNEILENAVSPLALAFKIGLGLVNDLDNSIISSGLKQTFTNNGISLSDNAAVSVDEKNTRWVIADGVWRYIVSTVYDEQTHLPLHLRASTVPQTRGTPEELSANPEYINQKAYDDTLSQQVYPFALPLNLWVEEARAYLEHLGVRRYKLMETFHKGAPPSELTDIPIASEYLGLTTVELAIITGAGSLPPYSHQPWEFWGLAEGINTIPDPADTMKTIRGTWTDVLGRVHVFLKRSELTYKELLDLLKTRFINPSQSLRIDTLYLYSRSVKPEDRDTCDPSKLIIVSLDQSALERMHRFIRLWRKLGWTMRELDQAITALKPADLNPTFLVQLSHIQRLRAELKVPLLRMLSWWAPIDSTRYDDATKSPYEQVFLNKTVMNPVDVAFQLNDARTELRTIGNITDRDHIPALLAGLGINDADLSLLTKREVVQETLNLPESEIQDNVLNLANLSHLYRIVSLAKALKLSIRDFLLVKVIAEINPFDVAHTENTPMFVEKVRKIRASGFSIAELDYLLRHHVVTPSTIAPTEESIALILDEIRVGLQKIAAENAFVPDPTGDLTRKKLVPLKWDETVIEQAITTLNGSAVYETTLVVLPAGIAFPPDTVKNKASHDKVSKKLKFIGPMTLDERASLLHASNDPEYQSAVGELFNAPRAFVSQKMKVFEWPAFSASLDALPSDVAFPNELKDKVYYEVAAKKLWFIGLMTEAHRAALLKLSSDSAYQTAINTLFDAPNAHDDPKPNNRFLTPADASRLFDSLTTADGKPIDAEYRFNYVLMKLLAYIRTSSSENLLAQKLGETFKLEAGTIKQLLTQWVNSPIDSNQKSITVFLARDFAESNSNVKLTADAFPGQFKTFTLLQKITMLLSKLKVSPDQLTWLFDQDHIYGPSVGWLDLNSLPLEQTSSTTLFDGWERLVDLFQLRDHLPLGQEVLSEIFALSRNAQTTKAALLQKLSELTGWSLDDLEVLVGKEEDVNDTGLFGFTFPDAYKDEQALKRLRACFVMLKRLGVSAVQCSSWAKADPTSDDARRIKQTVKAKYDNEQWLTVAKPLRDILRAKQRSALVSYLVANPRLVGRKYLRDSNELFDHFLIDVEMDPCMMTSRIKQAISSVQLFVQRCLMNLEEEQVVFSPEDVREWKWMKNYRVWEANRKVFLYPENWIEPDLRDNKSPFFKDLENELLQNEVTKDSAEDTFSHYLEKLDQVARLEICGMYYQIEPPHDDDHILILHVFGRTIGTPHIYYYRQWVDLSYWTPWEKVDVDIEGDHLIPVVYNRRLRIFWPIFTKKMEQQPFKMPSPDAEVKEAPKYWEIKMAWSEYKNKKWSAKKVSKEALVLTSDHLPPPGELVGSLPTDAEDPELLNKSMFTFKGLNGNSIFIPDAKKDHSHEPLLIRCYTFGMRNCPQPSSTGEGMSSFSIYAWWPIGEFSVEGCYDEPSPSYLTGCNPLLVPKRSWIRNMMLVEESPAPGADLDSGDDQLYLLALNPTGVAVSSTPLPANIPSTPILGETPGIFRVLFAHQFPHFLPLVPFFYQDKTRNFLVTPPDWVWVYFFEWLVKWLVEANSVDPGLLLGPDKDFLHLKSFLFKMFYHPYVCEFIKQLNRYGVDGLLDPGLYGEATWPPRQSITNKDFFALDYVPEGVDKPFPEEDVDFSFSGAYSLYNWELFFHAPLLIADRLSKNQRFEEAQQWFHYIFDPTAHISESELNGAGDPSARFWKVRPFYENADVKKTIEELMKLLNEGDEELERQVEEWRKNPFNPHLIARLRITPYEKTVVMKYIDNLIAWGDQLFRRDTIESINEATQLYILAAKILGDRPEDIPPRVTVPVHTYNQLESKLDHFSNAVVAIENLIPPLALRRRSPDRSLLPTRKDKGSVTLSPTFYFCIPRNDNLLGYWDTVADRLFKIRHCMNIEGVVRELPLFEPPIDPALLVRAVAAGIDISSVLNDMNAALPHYRFGTMLQKANELCADVKALGAALLSALEKKDAEALAQLRSSHEIKVLEAVRQVKTKQSDEAKETWDSLNKYKDVVTARQQYYSTRPKKIPAEQAHLDLMTASIGPQGVHALLEVAAGIVHLLPDAKLGFPATVGATYGGSNIAAGLHAFGHSLGITASVLSTLASMCATEAGYKRRQDDWDHQANLATKELKQVDKQICAADIRKQIAEKEVENHDLQVENAKEVDEYMRSKFTNQELYDWMVGQISAIYFQSYQLAYDVAKRAERAYRFELGLEDSNFVQFGYWDSLKKGLLAGEKLHHDLKRMEMAYLDQHKREYEITKHISLAMLDPVALVMLKETGECFVNLPEVIFDLDYPGHYMRRIKSVSLTIPCVTGPYASVNCTLTLLGNSVRIKNTPARNEGNYSRDEENREDDSRFKDNVGAIQSIATSNAQNDSGMFELNFRDERYLPFEGAGVISNWRLELSGKWRNEDGEPVEFTQFDFNTISDVIFQIRYTAREGGGLLKQQAITELQGLINQITLAQGRKGLSRLFSAKHEFPSEWYKFLHDQNPTMTLELNLDAERFPFQFRGKMIQIDQIGLFVKRKDSAADQLLELFLTAPSDPVNDPFNPPNDPAKPYDPMELRTEPTLGNLLYQVKTYSESKSIGKWMIKARKADIDPIADVIEDVGILCHYSVTE